MSDEPTKTADPEEPSAECLEEVPEVRGERFRRRPGRGHDAGRSAGGIVAIEPDLWAHFGSQEAVNEALRRLVEGVRER